MHKRSYQDRTPFYEALRGGKLEVLQVFLHHMFNSSDSTTPLHRTLANKDDTEAST